MDTLPPTTKHRRGRRTARQERALAAPGEALVALVDLPKHSAVLGRTPLVLDVGFGSGEAVIALAEADPDTTIIAVDMHTPGIGDLLASIAERDISNIRVVEADVRHVLQHIPTGRLSGARTFFPDPWPKKRHHRRRLVTTAFAEDLARCVHAGGYWHLATDWPDYAIAIDECVSASAAWHGGKISRPAWRSGSPSERPSRPAWRSGSPSERPSRPAWRPETRYERRGRAAGREPIDLWFERVNT